MGMGHPLTHSLHFLSLFLSGSGSESVDSWWASVSEEFGVQKGQGV